MARAPSIDRGNFYLGAPYDLETKTLAEKSALYRAKDLVTHGVCIGMTGSGKTGLCVALLEECALAGIPVLAIDPKGDLTNLKLAFPELRGQDFAPFIAPDAAAAKGLSVEEYAAREAENWRKGLANWGLGEDSIRRYREAAEVTIFTPGSTAGMPLDILRSLDPPENIADLDDEFIREEIAGVVSALLGLIRRSNVSPHDREHILPATLLEKRWKEKQPTTLPDLINLLQAPPITSLGALDLETFFPAADRRKLAFELNGLVASPSFQTWLQGEPLDIPRLLRTPDQRPRISILYLAHLSDAERMFFVTLILNQLIAWVRRQPGSSDLRALLYFDEVAGYLPPHPVNPPSKQLLLSLLKQGRAFGTSAMLVTQNPVDLDYKAISNCGTWLLGKLQTEQDKARVLDGLQSAAGESGKGIDRRAMDILLGKLGQRVFLLHNVHAAAPQVIHSRWAMSYLAGPLTREQIRRLQPPAKAAATESQAAGLADFLPQVETVQPPENSLLAVPPAAPSGLSVAFLAASAPRFEPRLFFRAVVTYRDRSSGTSSAKNFFGILHPTDELDWAHAELREDRPSLETQPPPGARFTPLPPACLNLPALKALGGTIADFLLDQAALEIRTLPAFKLKSQPGESVEEFAKRVQDEAAARLRALEEKITAEFSAKVRRLEMQIQVAKEQLARNQERVATFKQQEMAGLGSTLLSVLTGRRGLLMSKIGTSLRGASSRRATTQRAEITAQKSAEALARLEEQLAALEVEKANALAAAQTEISAAQSQLATERLLPSKGNIRIEAFGILWVPTPDPD